MLLKPCSRFLTATVVGLSVFSSANLAHAQAVPEGYQFPSVRPAQHKVAPPMPLELNKLVAQEAQLQKVSISIVTPTTTRTWALGQRAKVVLLHRLSLLEPHTGQAPADDYGKPRGYTRLEVQFTRGDSRPMPALHVYTTLATNSGDGTTWVDPQGGLERWLLSTARQFEDRVFANEVLNIETFRDCAWAGNYVNPDTTPPQCILPDGGLYLAVDGEPFNPAITTFAACYAAKRPVIDEFPRKCVLPGGRVVVEPGKVKGDTPAEVVPVVAPTPAKPEAPKAKAKAAMPVATQTPPAELAPVPTVTAPAKPADKPVAPKAEKAPAPKAAAAPLVTVSPDLPPVATPPVPPAPRRAEQALPTANRSLPDGRPGLPATPTPGAWQLGKTTAAGPTFSPTQIGEPVMTPVVPMSVAPAPK